MEGIVYQSTGMEAERAGDVLSVRERWEDEGYLIILSPGKAPTGKLGFRLCCIFEFVISIIGLESGFRLGFPSLSQAGEWFLWYFRPLRFL